MKRYVDPLTDLGPSLLEVEKPARYTGGEFGRLVSRPQPENQPAVLTAGVTGRLLDRKQRRSQIREGIDISLHRLLRRRLLL